MKREVFGGQRRALSHSQSKLLQTKSEANQTKAPVLQGNCFLQENHKETPPHPSSHARRKLGHPPPITNSCYSQPNLPNILMLILSIAVSNIQGEPLQAGDSLGQALQNCTAWTFPSTTSLEDKSPQAWQGSLAAYLGTQGWDH